MITYFHRSGGEGGAVEMCTGCPKTSEADYTINCQVQSSPDPVIRFLIKIPINI